MAFLFLFYNVFEGLADLELYGVLGWDLNHFAGPWIATLAGITADLIETAEPGNPYTIAIHDVHDDRLEDGVDHPVCLGLVVQGSCFHGRLDQIHLIDDLWFFVCHRLAPSPSPYP